MSTIIAVYGFPQKWTIAEVVRKLARALVVNFVSLGFAPLKSTKGKTPKQVRSMAKTIFLRLPFGMDPYQAINKLNNNGVPHAGLPFKVKAFIPTDIPDYVLRAKPKHIPPKVRKFLHIREELPPQQAVLVTYKEIMTEMQSKYTGLYNLSNQTEHRLLENIGEVVYTRLCKVMEANPTGNCFFVSKNYRRIHPHFGDFELILNTYKELVPEGDINEAEFTMVSTHPYSIDNVPYDKIQSICHKYTEKIVSKVNEHLKGLNSDLEIETDTEEDIARKKVRAELKKLSPYMSVIVKQVITQHFIPNKSPFHRLRIYGEPFMPPREALADLLHRHRAVHTERCSRMFNLLKFNIPPSEYGSLMAMDGTLISGAKMIVRSSDMPVYIPMEAVRRAQALVGGDCDEILEDPEDEDEDEDGDEDMEAEDQEPWN